MKSSSTSSANSCEFQPSSPAGESAKACATVCGPCACILLYAPLFSQNHCMCCMAACSSSLIPSNSPGAPDGNEKICVTCTPTTCSPSMRPSSGEMNEP